MSTNEFIEKLDDELGANLKNILRTEKQMKKIEKDIKLVEGWYKEAKKGRDGFLSKTADIIISKIMPYLPKPFSNMLIDKIKIETQNKTKVKFNFSVKLDPLRPYVEFVKMVNGIDALKIKTVFKIDPKMVAKNIEVKKVANKKIISSGSLDISLKFSLSKLGVNGFDFERPQKLGEKRFTVDLSRFQISL